VRISCIQSFIHNLRAMSHLAEDVLGDEAGAVSGHTIEEQPLLPPVPASPLENTQKFLEFECIRVATMITKTDAQVQEQIGEIRRMQDIIKQKEDSINQMRAKIVHLQGCSLAYRAVEKHLKES
jgi:hypothetical protein